MSFYGLSNGTTNVFFGKLAYSPVGDLSFKEYSWLKNFKTIVGLYRAKPISNASFEMIFDNGVVQGETDESGSFWCEAELNEKQTKLVEISLKDTNEKVLLTEDLYPNKIHSVESHTIVISDLDDTLMHSFIRNKFTQVRTLLFTTVEKRKTVKDMAHLIKRFALAGADAADQGHTVARVDLEADAVECRVLPVGVGELDVAEFDLSFQFPDNLFFGDEVGCRS